MLDFDIVSSCAKAAHLRTIVCSEAGQSQCVIAADPTTLVEPEWKIFRIADVDNALAARERASEAFVRIQPVVVDRRTDQNGANGPRSNGAGRCHAPSTVPPPSICSVAPIMRAP